MIENSNASKSAAAFVNPDIYLGVASVNVLAVNPDNDKLRKYGWNIPEGADEPKYVIEKERDGKMVKSARVRFLVQIQDLQDKPIIPLDFWIRPEVWVNKDGTKCQIIDAYGRTAWGTKEDVKSSRIPQYASGPANISANYKYSHRGQEELVRFLMKYLNMTPFQVYNRTSNTYVDSKNPGKLTIDHWDALVNGNAAELREYVAMQPENCVKVVLGYSTTEDNKKYQTFLNSSFFSNALSPDSNGEYAAAKKAIEKYEASHQGSNTSTTFSAEPVKKWEETPTDVKDQSFGDLSDFSTSDTSTFDDDLPFA